MDLEQSPRLRAIGGMLEGSRRRQGVTTDDAGAKSRPAAVETANGSNDRGDDGGNHPWSTLTER